MGKCRECGNRNAEGAIVCQGCGIRIGGCVQCGTPVGEDTLQCPRCGLAVLHLAGHTAPATNITGAGDSSMQASRWNSLVATVVIAVVIVALYVYFLQIR
jgi:uncharacterized membrane protein YvbJ